MILLGGDFRQCLPVVPHAHRVAIVQTTKKYSSLWIEFKLLELHQNVRSMDSDYSLWLTKLGNGELNNSDYFDNDIIEVPDDLISNCSIVNDIFGSSLMAKNVSQCSAILCPRNKDAITINENVLNLLDGKIPTFYSIESVECEDSSEKDYYAIEFLNSLTPAGMPPHELNLKEGAIIMLLRN